MSNVKIQSTYCTERPSYQDWCNQLKVSSMYVEKNQYRSPLPPTTKTHKLKLIEKIGQFFGVTKSL